MTRFIHLARLVLVAVFVYLSARYIPNVEFDNSLSRWISASSQELTDYERFLEDFQGDARLILAIELGSRATADGRNKILNDLKSAIGDLGYVNRVSQWPIPLIRLKKKPSDDLLCIVVSFNPESHVRPNRPELLERVETVLGQSGHEYHIAGTGVLNDAINKEAKASTKKFLVIAISMLIALLLVVLKNPVHLLMALTVSLGSICSLLLYSSISHTPLSMIGMVLPVIMLFYGTSHSLHILYHGGNFRRVLAPCILAALTTSLGFAVFIADPIPLLKDFGALAISGIMGAFVWTLIVFYPQTTSSTIHASTHDSVGKFVASGRRYAIPIALVTMLLMVPGYLKIRPDIYSPAVLSPHNPTVLDHQFIEQNVGNYVPLEFVVPLADTDFVALRAWEDAVFELPEVTGKLSYLDFARLASTPLSRSYGPATFGYESKDGKLGRITFLVPLLSTRQGAVLLEKIDSLSARFFADQKPRATGYVTIYARIAQQLNDSFIGSLSSGFGWIFLVIALYLRDIRLLLASIVPNIFPIVFLLGIMGWLDIPLDMATVPVGCLILGIIVDDSVHFLYWYKETSEIPSALRNAGPGMVSASLVICLGFSVFLTSSSPPIRYFGFLSIAGFLSALAADIFLLPAMIELLVRRAPETVGALGGDS